MSRKGTTSIICNNDMGIVTIHKEDHDSFRSTFEDSETMKKFMQQIPLALLTIQDIGFAGGMELAKKL